MRMVLAGLIAAGLIPLLSAWRANRETSLSHALIWSLLAWLSWGIAFVFGNPEQPGMDPGQQKIMKFMPVIFIAFFYRMSAGLVVYWTISNLLTIAQTKFTKMGADPAAATPASSGKKK